MALGQPIVQGYTRARGSPQGHVRYGGWQSPGRPSRGAAVLCHPHPLYGGSMSSAINPAMQRALEAKRWSSLRFNFRGVRLSEGRYGGGVAEVKDVSAALDRVADAVPGASLAVAGWS